MKEVNKSGLTLSANLGEGKLPQLSVRTQRFSAEKVYKWPIGT